MKLVMSLMLILSLNAFSQERTTAINEDHALNVLGQVLAPSETCMDEYLTRSKQLKRFLIWAPPVSVVGAAGMAYGGGALGVALTSATADGFAALANALGGAFLGGGSVLITFAAFETVKAIQYARNKNTIELIANSYANNLDNKRIVKFVKKYNRKYPMDKLNAGTLATFIRDFDGRGLLCDNTIRMNSKTKKLKHKLARRKDIISYLHSVIGQ
jgi:thiamine pyrophosphate-dependent acetolactate synthase large subunit-like protein